MPGKRGFTPQGLYDGFRPAVISIDAAGVPSTQDEMLLGARHGDVKQPALLLQLRFLLPLFESQVAGWLQAPAPFLRIVERQAQPLTPPENLLRAARRIALFRTCLTRG